MNNDIDITNQIHLVQTKLWNKFKQNYGTKIVSFEDIYFLVKKIPLSNKYVAYAPKVNFNVQKVNFKKLKRYCAKNNISFVRFDIPNVDSSTKAGKMWNKKLSKMCTKSPRNTFTKSNLYLNVEPSIQTLLANMHQKRRYNIRYAERKGIKVDIKKGTSGLDTFYKLHKSTSNKQKFLTHSKKYFSTAAKVLGEHVYFIQASYKNKVLVSWFVIIDKNTGYYVYGGSSDDHKNLHPSDLVGFKAIELAKQKGAKLFDFWGAEEGKGFTDFKRKYGAVEIEYLPSYDFVIDKFSHTQFNFMYQGFWKLQELKKKLTR